MTLTPFNPLDMENLALSIGNALLTQAPTQMSSLPAFTGAGIYALYYTGDFPAYQRLAAVNKDGRFEQPIYVGKAIPSGGRRGLSVATTTRALSSRIREHRDSVTAATNLDVGHFWARWLVVEPIWVPLGENLLISRFAPVWNALLDGFGNHDPGAGRRVGENSRWDTLHPGRGWAALSAPRREDAAAITQDVSEYLRSRLGD